VVIFAVALSLLTGVLFGLAPIRQATRVDLTSMLGSARMPSPTTRRKLGSSLVVAQVAIAVVLLTAATLFLRTLANLEAVDLGFRRERLVIVDVNPRAAGYRDAAYARLCERLLERFAALPGIALATFSENGLLTGRDSSTNRMRPDSFPAGPEGIPKSYFDLVGPRYFATLGISLLAGRDFDAHDDDAGRRVVVINEAMARRFFGDRSPLGQTMLWGPPNDSRRLEIVGVSRDVRQHNPRDRPELRFYVPYFQHGEPELASARFLLRTTTESSAATAMVRQAVVAEDQSLPIERVDTGPALIDRTLVKERMVAVLSMTFTGLALLLACVGLYGLMSYRVVQRTSEIGVRMALGAARGQILWMVLRYDLFWIGTGVAIGAPFAVAAFRFIRSLLFGIDAASPSLMVIPTTVMLVAGIVAGAGPALRAARVDPAVSLRHD
jgi:predicted permease